MPWRLYLAVLSGWILQALAGAPELFAAEATSASYMCHDETLPQPRKTYTPFGKPSYWITVSPDGSSLAYMAPTGNEMIDIREDGIGATVKAPGLVDLQFSADQEFVTLVNKHQGRETERHFGVQHGTSWYRTEHLFAYFDRTKLRNAPIYDGSQFPNQARKIPRAGIDPNFFNHYHSMAVLEDASGQRIHRVLNDLRGASARDYSWQDAKLVPGAIYDLASDGDAIDRFGNSYFDLPMLAKNGKYFGIYNRKTMTTQIYAIVNGKRRFMVDLGLETGKIAFSFQEAGSKELYVAFHVDFIVHEEGNKVTGEMAGQTKDIMVFKLEAESDADGNPSLRKLAYAKVTQSYTMGEGYYYPQWSRDGGIFFVAVGNQGATYRFVKVQLEDLHFQPFNLPQKLSPYESSCGRTRFHSLVALGSLWGQACSGFAGRLSAANIALKALGLSERQCMALAKNWPRERQAILAQRRLFSLEEPHQRSGRIRPDGRWTAKGEARRELFASRSELEALSVEELEAACLNAGSSYEELCP